RVMVVMRKLVNLYLVLFLLDGIISLVDVLAGHFLHALRGFVAFFPFILAFPLYCIIGCMRGFPKRALLPPIIFTAWTSILFGLPLPFFLGMDSTEQLLSVVQPILGIGVLLAVKRSGQSGGWIYGAEAFEHIKFSGKRLCGFIAGNALIVIPLMVLYLGVSASIGVAYLSRGFIHLDAKGLRVEARTYQYKGKSILLLPTVHIADRSFYSDLLSGLPAGKTVIIPEGVSDEQNLLAAGLGYEKIASALGLEAQNGQTFSPNTQFPTNPCDIDVSMLSPEVVNYLNAISYLFHNINSENQSAALTKYMATPQPDTDLMMKEILTDRNRRVVACIQDSIENYDTIVVPWGAAHMPGIERALLDQGAEKVDSRRVWVMRWSAIGAVSSGKQESRREEQVTNR
ncbi:MAG: hypothetical protein JXR40_12520, partial [Pontiellaceae bacterium]|nr:hypothetical protein [Pontiellaceae bacterium]